MLCLDEVKRIAGVFRVFLRHRLFTLAYSDIYREHISDRGCTCEVDLEHRDRAARLREAFEELGVTFMKLGQMLSRRPDLIPPAYIMELEKLQDHVPPLEFPAMREAVERVCTCTAKEHRELGTHSPTCYHCMGFEGIFEEFDEKPIASASIAQVYRARLKGRDVAVKIARPGVIDQINLDLRILGRMGFILSRILKIDTSRFIDELRRKLVEEVDFRNEALNIEIFRGNFKGFEGVRIPEVYWEYSRDNILVMEYVEGLPLHEARLSREEARRIAGLIAEAFFKQVYLDNFFHSDPHPGNIFVLGDGGIAFLDFGGVGRIDESLREDIYQLFYAAYHRDVDRASEALLRLGRARDVDLLAFKADMARIIQFQHLVGTGEKKSDQYVSLGLKYNLELPPTFMVLARAMVLLESTVLELDPMFDMMEVARRYVKKLTLKNVKEHVEELPEMAEAYYHLISEMPGHMRSIVQAIEDGTKARGRESLSKSIVIAALLLGSSLLLIQNIFFLRLLGGAGFALGVLYSVRELGRSV